MKKTLREAMNRAKRYSESVPTILVRVLDKNWEPATFTGSEWVYNDLMSDGWDTVVTFRGGKEVRGHDIKKK